MRFGLCVFALLLAQPLRGQASPPAARLETGTILPHVPCAAHPEQSYALYLPANYSPDRQWPLVVSSDPAARGNVPLELEKDAAEKFGYVLVASNDSRNGLWKPRFDSTDATLTDVQTRASVDPGRIYFAGFSGGARENRAPPEKPAK